MALPARLTAVLGRHPDQLNEDDLRRAVDRQIPEGVDLAWKKGFPQGTDEGKKELAKDVCAMANTGGGLLVIGVDDGGQDHAHALAPSEPAQGRGEEWIRAVLAKWIQPAVPHIGVRTVKSSIEAGKVYWLLTVPASTQTHAVATPGSDYNFRVHVRHGTTTRTLAEPEIAQRYRSRADPLETAALNGAGSVTLRGYEYQTHVAARAVLEMLADEAVRHVTCEHIEDVIIARAEEQAKDGLIWEFQQIKMRQAATPWAFRDVLANKPLQSLWRTYGTVKGQGLSYRLSAALEGLLDPADALVTALARGEGAGNEHCMERVTAHLKGDAKEVSAFLGLIRIQELPTSEDIESRNVAFLHDLGSPLAGVEINGLYAELVHRVRKAMQGRLDPQWIEQSTVQDLSSELLGKRIGPSAIADFRQRLQLPGRTLSTGFSQRPGEVAPAQVSEARNNAAPYEARGLRRDYQCERLPFHRHEDGMADVFYATHKPTGTPVVLKKLHDQHPHLDKKARMTREIEVGRLLSDHPNAMPVWDASADGTWFVMPKAQAVATECLDELEDPALLRDLIESLCSVLIAAHGMQAPGAPHGWVHRDIKPSNVLRLDGRWVLADWGIVRRPPGQTTHAQRTRLGVSMGSEGFAAPELSSDAHRAEPSTDIYSLGQLIGWAITRKHPQQNIPLVPESGPWRAIVRGATRTDPGRRPATVQAFLDLVAQEIDTPPEPPVVQGEMLRDALNDGAANASEELVALAAVNPDDAALYCDVLLNVDPDALMPALLADPSRALEVVRALPELLGTHRPVENGEVDAVIMWLFTVARRAATTGQLLLLEESCNGAFLWDALWDQWRPQEKITLWLRTLTGDAAGSVAGALRDHPDCADHFSSLANEFRVDHRIRSAVSQGEHA
ncbi:dsDNA nuclease domain-containing protein [Streptomyces microflavus]|uniref:dsDNA nuclease domain-containing protein n=1 Tax=Streptomyces microflavus TaxID=1919 RepID=UPI0036E3327C